MREVYKILELDKYEIGIVINALNDFRNKLINEEKEIYSIDEVLLKVLDAPEKRKCFRRERYAVLNEK